MKNSALDILYVGTLPPYPGGSAIVGYQLLEGFARQGHRVRALAPITPDSKDDFRTAHPEIELNRIVVSHFETPPHFPYSSDLLKLEKKALERKIEKLISQNRPDLIVIGRETYIRYVPDIARAHDLPTLLIVHGGLTHGIVDGSYDSQIAEQLLAQYKKAHVVVTPAEHMARSLRNLGVEVTVIPNGVNLQLFSPSSNGTNNIVVMYVGHLRELKRPLDFVLGADLALQRNPHLSFVVVGEGPLRETMAEICRKKGIAHKFRFVGWVSHSAIPAYLKSATIIVTPTQIENQSLIHLEAQACGRVLVSSDIPAAREVIADGHTGLLFPTGDVEQLAGKVLHAASDHELRNQMGDKARLAVEKYSMERTVHSYVALMQRMLQRWQ